ncbi:TonB-dependent receptor [Bowmanella pacifica]|nr:TonB-dependent receptor [Bowmanella pacifica]
MDGMRGAGGLSYGILLGSYWLLAGQVFAAEPSKIRFNIPPLQADKALTLFAEQADLTLVFPYEIARKTQANAVTGDMTVSQAAYLLLQGTRLQPSYLADGRLKIAQLRTQPVEEQNVKQHKLSAIAAFLSSLFIAPNVTAQMSEDGTVEEIVVTGQKLSRLRALDTKRNASMLMEALSTDNLGRLPDKNAAESLNRLPGVSILIEKGEGRFASIRGIRPDWNRVTVNGFETGSPEKDGSGRSMPLDILGGELLQSVEVYKAKTADMDGEGIGGTVNIVTKRPLDTDELQVTTNLRYGFESADQDNPYYDSDDPYNFDVAASGRINERLGWNLGASTSHRQYLAQGIYQDDWAEISGVAYPEQTKNNYYVVGRDRDTAVAGLQYKASDTTTLMLQGFYSQFDEFQHRNRFRQGIEQDGELIADINGDTVTMVPGGSFIRADLRREDINKKLLNLSFSGETLSGSWLHQYGINFGHNEISEPNADWGFRQNTPQDLGPDSWSLNENGVLEIAEGGLQHNLASNLRFHDVSYQNDSAEQDVFSAKFDSEYAYTLNGYAGAVKFGGKYSRSKKSFDYNNLSYDIERNNLADFNVTDGAFLNDVDGQARANLWFNLDALNALLHTNPELFDQVDDNGVANLASDRSVEEQVSAVYIMNTLQLNKLELVAGLRFEQTDVTSNANQRIDDKFEPVSIEGDNSVVLPSLIANYHFTDKLIGRASYTTALGRPNYGDISATSSFGIDENGDGVLSIGNPDLEPYTADNLDLALEWYPTDASLLSVAWFQKDIDNIIINDEKTLSGGSYEGIDYGVDELVVRTKRNADTAEVRGVEFNIQHQFSNLPQPFDGVGAMYSYTNIDAEFYDSNIGQNRKLEGQPEEIQSFTLFYEDDNLYVGLTYNYNASFLTDSNDLQRVEDDVEQGEFGRWDLRMSYNLSDSLTLYFDANNINDEPTTEFQGGNEAWNTEYEYVGTTYYFGLTYSL